VAGEYLTSGEVPAHSGATVLDNPVLDKTPGGPSFLTPTQP